MFDSTTLESIPAPLMRRTLSASVVLGQLLQLLLLPIWVSPLTPWCGIMAYTLGPSISPVWMLVRKVMSDIPLMRFRVSPGADIVLAANAEIFLRKNHY